MPTYKSSLSAKPAAAALDGTESWWMLQGGASVEGTALQLKEYTAAELLGGANTWTALQTFSFNNFSLGLADPAAGGSHTFSYETEVMTSGTNKELVLQNDALANVLAIKNNDPNGYSAIAFRDNTGAEYAAVGVGNNHFSTLYGGLYLETSGSNTSPSPSAPASIFFVQTGAIGFYSPDYHNYLRCKFTGDGYIKFYGGAASTFATTEHFVLSPGLSADFAGKLTVTAQAGGKALVLAGGTQTTSQPLISGTQTWNASGVTFEGFTIDITHTASAAASTLFNTKVGGTEYFGIRRNLASSGSGLLLNNSGIGNNPALCSNSVSNPGFLSVGSNNVAIGLVGTDTSFDVLVANHFVRLLNGSVLAFVADAGSTVLFRTVSEAANVLSFASGGGVSAGGTWRAIPTTPAQITSNQDNYNPGGTSYFQRWSTDASRNVTGMTFTAAQINGQTHMIVNVGAQDIVLKHNTTSTAANRFQNTAGADITLTAGQQAIAIYDATSGGNFPAWRVSKLN
jgi:hypothetical protein